MKKILVYSSIVMFLASCAKAEKQDETTVKPTQPVVETKVEVKEEVPEKDDFLQVATQANEATFNGTLVIHPENHATISLPIDGIVKKTNLLSGAYVKKGAVIATLENLEFIELQQNYLESHAQTEYLEAEYKRQQVLAGEEAASQKKLQQSKAEYLSMKSRRDAAAAQLSLLDVKAEDLLSKGIMSLLEIKAPISGHTANVQMNTGKYVSAGEPLCEIIDKNDPLIKITAYEKDLEKIKVGDAVEFYINSIGADEKFSGTIISVGQHVNKVNRSLDVFAKVNDNDPRLRSGMYVNVKIVR